MPVSSGLDQRSVSLAALELYSDCGLDYDRQILNDCQYRTPAEVARLFQSNPDAEVSTPWLDLGGGTGLVGCALNDARIEINLFALDNSRTMLSELRANAYVACYLTDVLEPLPFPDGSIPGAFAIGVSEHIVDLNQFFANVARCLIGGGWLYFSYCPSRAADVSRESSGFLAHSPRIVGAALRHHGFEITSDHEIDAYQSGPEGWMKHGLVAARRSVRL